ncbi:hypothetical protein ABN028_34325 [Actinopolymorpha sp. B17G11]|uniref:hypothetical protein n=1 Tax=Actinopolymorpha sp. B17G11 TaxID=3160861 RepID=UPI0032E49A74
MTSAGRAAAAAAAAAAAIASFAVAAALATAAGCGAPADEEKAAASVARAFHAAVDHRQGTAACDLLAPQTRRALERVSQLPCAKAVLAGKLAAAGDVRTVRLAGDQAQVALARDTVFLAVSAKSWKIVAAGCRPRGGQQPYVCLIAES